MVFIPPANKVWRYIGITCPSVALSVRPSDRMTMQSCLVRIFMEKNSKFLLYTKITYDLTVCQDFAQGHLGKLKVTRSTSAKFVSGLYLPNEETLEIFTIYKDCL